MAVEDRLREREKAYAWAGALCGYAGADREFLEDFWGRLTADEEIYEEFVYYLEHQDFLCKVKIEGYGLVDLMIFQSAYYTDKAEDLHERERSIKAARGRILDRNAVVLADNKTVCTISVIRTPKLSSMTTTSPRAIHFPLTNRST